MVDDKYIGLALAISGSLAIGMSFIITKKGLNDAAERNSYGAPASDNLSYLRNPIWWAGISTLVIGEIANFAAYTFAPPIMVTPLGALSVIIGAVLASFLLDEELGHLGRLGCTLCLLGSLIIVLHAPEDKPVETVDEILHYAVQPGFLLYCFCVTVFTLVMIYAVAPRYGRSNPLVYVSICSVVGSVSVMAIKGFGVAVKLTFSGKNQFSHPSTYVFGIVVALCIVIQMNYFNKALDTFSTNVVNPMYYVGFSTATIVASLILFQGFNTTDASNTMSLLAGLIITFLGVHLLNISRQESAAAPADPAHSALESGLMNPRLSFQGRTSWEAWGSEAETPRSARHGRTHGRRGSSLYRNQAATTLFNAFEQEEQVMNRSNTVPNGHGIGHVRGESLGMQKLREVDEFPEEEDEDADERTGLTRLAAQAKRGNAATAAVPPPPPPSSSRGGNRRESNGGLPPQDRQGRGSGSRSYPNPNSPNPTRNGDARSHH